MKKRTRILSLLLAIITAVLTMISCTKPSSEPKDTEKKDDPQNTSQADDSSETISIKDGFVIFANKSYYAKVILPEIATDSEKAVYAKLRGALKSKTTVNPDYYTDFVAADTERDPNEAAILIGVTNHQESINAYNSSPYGEYGISIVNNKIVFNFTTKEEGLELVEIFEASLKESSGAFFIKNDFSIKKSGFPQFKDIPKYPDGDQSFVDCNDGTSMVVASNTALAQYLAYCDTLLANGYELYSSRDDVEGNYFRTFMKAPIALTVYFAPSSKSTRIIAGPMSDVPPKEVDTTPEETEPSLTIVSQSSRRNNGLGLVYLLPNGKFLIIDGGYTLNDRLYDILKDLAPDKKNIVVTAWYISHPHGDHQQALMTMLRNHKDVKIESILYNYTTNDQYNAVTTGADGASGANSLRSTIEKNASKDTKIIKPHTGQVYEYGSTKVEIIYTVEDVLPTTLDYLNTSSLVVRVTMGDHSLLALADTTHVSSDIMRKMYGSYLESEMVQLAHHGTHPGYASLYATAKGKVLIWPSNYVNANDQIENSAVVEALNQATDVYVANLKDITLTLPYVPINNKQEILDIIQNS